MPHMLIRVNILMYTIVVNIVCSSIMKETLKLNHHYPNYKKTLFVFHIRSIISFKAENENSLFERELNYFRFSSMPLNLSFFRLET